MRTTYDSAIDLTIAVRAAAKAHGRQEEQIGHPDPGWYAQNVVDEHSRLSGQAGPGAST
jgi:hypothetical protein